MLRSAIMVLFCLGSVAIAASPPVVPSELKAKSGRILTIEAKSDGKIVMWAIGDEAADADLIAIQADGKRVLFSSPTAGRYQLLAWTADKDGPSPAARVIVTVEGGLPPVPPPPPPKPDEWQTELQRAYAADNSLSKSHHVKQLAAVYEQAANLVGDPTIQTTSNLAQRVRAASKTLLPDDAIIPLRRLAAEEVARLLGDGDRALTDELRIAARTGYLYIAKSLQEVTR